MTVKDKFKIKFMMGQETAPGAIKIFLSIIFIFMQGCGGKVNPGPAVGTFISRNLNSAAASPHDWKVSEVANADLAGTVSGTTLSGMYGDVGGVEALGSGGTLRASLPPALGARASGDYLMAFAEFNDDFNNSPSSQMVFAAAPSVSTAGLFTWPASTPGYFSAGSGLNIDYTMGPIINQVYGGAGVLGFLAKPTAGAITASDYELYAWVRAKNSNVWIGDSEGSAKAALVSGATVSGLEPSSYGVYLPQFSSDYNGGFLATWLGRSSALAYSAKAYLPFSGWGSLTYPGLVANTMVAGATNPDPRAMTYADGVSPSVGVGLAAEFLPDASGNAWFVQVVTSGGLSTLHKAFYDGLRGGFLTTTDIDTTLRPSILIASAINDILYSPVMYVDSSGNFTVFYVVTTGGAAATGTVKYIKFNKAGGTITSPAVASTTNATFDYSSARADATTDYGEVPKIIMKKSPDNTKIMVVYPTTNNSVMVLKYDGTQFVDWQEISSPTGLGAYSFDGAINDSGDALLVIGFEDAADATLSKLYGFRAFPSYNSGAWNSGTAITPLLGACLLSTLKVSAVIDNSSHGMAAITCTPVVSGISYMSRNLVVPFR